MLKTKCILYPYDKRDGIRISVMSRHTLNDGITPHPEINGSCYNLWIPDLAPPLKLIGDYYKRGLSWEKFEERYLYYIRNSGVDDVIKNLARRSLNTDITLLCIEPTSEHCHRRLLAEEFKLYLHGLELQLN